MACVDDYHYAPISEIGADGSLKPKPSHQRVLIEDKINQEFLKMAKQDLSSFALPYSSHQKSSQMQLNDKAIIHSWVWPASGRVISSPLQKGINIIGKLGDPIFASGTGSVVYCGNGLHGYGNLIIIKHNRIYLSAYAHNRKVLVKEGDKVKQGQKIAEMGNTGAERVMLYFEIRQNGKAIDPIRLLRHF